MVNVSSLVVSGLSAGYGKKTVIRDVSVTAPPGLVTAVVGANGSGKSTLLKAVMGLCNIEFGDIAVNGTTIPRSVSIGERAMQHGCLLVPQTMSVFPDLTVEDNIRIGIQRFVDRSTVPERVAAAFKQFGIFNDRRNRKAATLSGGERQLLALTVAFARSPHVLLLDEPTSGLSPNRAREVMDTIGAFARDRHVAVVIVEHALQELKRIADSAYILREGVVSYAGSPDILTSPELSSYFL